MGDLWLPADGRKLIIVDPLVCKSPEQFYNLVSREKVTILNQTPTAFKGFIKADNLIRYTLNLRYVIFGGEALYFNMLRNWEINHPLTTTKLINMYGITETTIHVTYYEITHKDIYKNDKSIIGVPLRNLVVYVTDQELNILPKGVKGELLVCGNGVVKGYFRNDELTTKKFVYVPRAKQIAFRSGDLVKINQQNQIEYLAESTDKFSCGDIESNWAKSKMY